MHQAEKLSLEASHQFTRQQLTDTLPITANRKLLPRCRPAWWDLSRSHHTWFQPDSIIDGVAESLFAAQVAFRRLYGNVSQQKLNLLQFPASLMTQTGACPSEIVGRERRNGTVLCLLLYDTPNDLGAEAGAPNPASLVDRTKERAGCNPGGPIQASIPAFTQSGTGIVRMWPPLPTRSAMTQCSSLCCMSSTRNAVSSALRSPHPSRIANVA